VATRVRLSRPSGRDCIPEAGSLAAAASVVVAVAAAAAIDVG